jgi:hypothetical protein
MGSNPSPAPLIPYSDTVTARGVTVTRDADTLRIRVPPKPLATFVSAHAATFTFVAFGLAGPPLGCIKAGQYAFAILALLGEGAATALAAYLDHLHTRSPKSGTLFELTSTDLTLSADSPPDAHMAADDQRRWSTTRPRHAITEIRYNPYDRALLIRAPGHNLLTGLLRNEDRRVIEYVAETLTAELATTPPRLTP